MVSKRKRSMVPADDSSAAASDPADAEPAPPTAECPFTVEYRSSPSRRNLPYISDSGVKVKRAKKASTPAKPGPGGAPVLPPEQQLDQTPPEDQPTVYSVKPKGKWEALKKYRNFVVGSETFALNDYIFVNHGNIPHGTDISGVDDKKFWVARVLEIRAVDEAHVYLRVYWLYWPEELPGGRQYYHGAKELVASNHMEIIDAMTVTGRAEVKHWMELDHDEILPDLFWRQKFDYPSQTLLEVREHCSCHRYYNPDTLMIGCTKCPCWLHEECIIADLKARIIARGPPAPGPLVAPPNPTPNPDTPKPKRPAAKGLLALAVDAADTPTSPPQPPPTATPANGAKSTPSKKIGGSKKSKSAERAELDKIEITIVTQPNMPAKAVIRDLRGVVTKDEDKKAANGNANAMDVDSTNEANGAENEGGAFVWEEDVRCLLCGTITEDGPAQ